jgi:hypothetical protein
MSLKHRYVGNTGCCRTAGKGGKLTSKKKSIWARDFSVQKQTGDSIGLTRFVSRHFEHSFILPVWSPLPCGQQCPMSSVFGQQCPVLSVCDQQYPMLSVYGQQFPVLSVFGHHCSTNMSPTQHQNYLERRRPFIAVCGFSLFVP